MEDRTPRSSGETGGEKRRERRKNRGWAEGGVRNDVIVGNIFNVSRFNINISFQVASLFCQI